MHAKATLEQPDSRADAPTMPGNLMEAQGSSSKQLKRPAKTLHVLYLYSGPHRPTDGLQVHLATKGFECTCVDTEINPNHDLLDQIYWESVLASLDNYDAFVLSPPSSTFSKARRGEGGTLPLRSASGPERYGMKNLAMRDKQRTREGSELDGVFETVESDDLEADTGLQTDFGSFENYKRRRRG